MSNPFEIGSRTTQYSFKKANSLSVKLQTPMSLQNSLRTADEFSITLDTVSYCEFQRVGDGTNNFLFNFSLILSAASVDLLVLFHNAMHFPKELLYRIFDNELDSKCFSTSVLATKFKVWDAHR